METKKFKGTISVDFDGVLHKYSKSWHDGTIYDPPIEGDKEALQKFLDAGYEVIIFSARAYDREINGFQRSQYIEIVEYLNEHQIPFTKVYQGDGKPFCKLYIDDNALRFEGNWGKSFDEAMRILEK